VAISNTYFFLPDEKKSNIQFKLQSISIGEKMLN